MQTKLLKPTRFNCFYLLAFLLLLPFQVQASDITCGQIQGFVFSNSEESVTIEAQENYITADLPYNFYVDVVIGNVGSVSFIVTNLDSGEISEITENAAPYTYPANGNGWNLGSGRFRVETYTYSDKYLQGLLCDYAAIEFSLDKKEMFCGDIENLIFSNGQESVIIENGEDYISTDLPNGFYVEAPANNVGSIRLVVININTGETYSVVENYAPYTFPKSEVSWDIGPGYFKVTADAYSKPNARGTLCGSRTIRFTLDKRKYSCSDIEGFVFSNNQESVNIVDNQNYITDDLPVGFYVAATLANIGSVNLIVTNLDTGEITQVTENATPYTFPANGVSWNLGSGRFRVEAYAYSDKSLQGLLCDSSVIEFSLDEEEVVCNADAGSLTLVTGNNGNSGDRFVNDIFDIIIQPGESVTIKATPNGDINVPNNYAFLYVLTQSLDLVIVSTAEEPSFEVTEAGIYTIHTLVYNPNTLDLSLVEYGITTGFDINSLLIQGGGSICGSLDIEGARVEVNTPPASKEIYSRVTKTDNFISEPEFNQTSLKRESLVVTTFPNPAVNELNVIFRMMEDEIMNVSIVDVSGLTIDSIIVDGTSMNNDTMKLNLAKYTSGSYLVIFNSNFRNVTKKIIVAK